MESMLAINDVTSYPVLRPVLSFDKTEIIKIAQDIDTYDLSILPYEDCCVLFSPKHPVLRASIEEAKKIYNEINPDELIKKSFEERVVKHFYANEAL